MTSIPSFYQSALDMQSHAKAQQISDVITVKVETDAEVSSTVQEIDESRDSTNQINQLCDREGNDLDSDEEIDVCSDDGLKMDNKIVTYSPVLQRGS